MKMDDDHGILKNIIKTFPYHHQKILKSIFYLTKREEEITSERLYDVYKKFAKGKSISYPEMFDSLLELEVLGIVYTKTISHGIKSKKTIHFVYDNDLLED